MSRVRSLASELYTCLKSISFLLNFKLRAIEISDSRESIQTKAAPNGIEINM
ncbi:hypothetical protein [Staphylococcus sp. 11-B-312]|uniref:hypothetical protein n=1 Tax=Staphylococcus sp. 11-B-312 TaxID=2799680 RepID=UPI001A7E15AD|nr:hypothetical protein [Staphylococcus sp. 11-B-312]